MTNWRTNFSYRQEFYEKIDRNWEKHWEYAVVKGAKTLEEPGK
jgi:hypothetical protein